MMHQVVPVVLCGGSGTRLWPLSRAGFSKRFFVLSGTSSLFQRAVERVNQLGTSGIFLRKALVVTYDGRRFLSLERLREVKGIDASLLLEHAGRNTALALTLAA